MLFQSFKKRLHNYQPLACHTAQKDRLSFSHVVIGRVPFQVKDGKAQARSPHFGGSTAFKRSCFQDTHGSPVIRLDEYFVHTVTNEGLPLDKFYQEPKLAQSHLHTQMTIYPVPRLKGQDTDSSILDREICEILLQGREGSRGLSFFAPAKDAKPWPVKSSMLFDLMVLGLVQATGKYAQEPLTPEGWLFGRCDGLALFACPTANRRNRSLEAVQQANRAKLPTQKWRYTQKATQLINGAPAPAPAAPAQATAPVAPAAEKQQKPETTVTVPHQTVTEPRVEVEAKADVAAKGPAKPLATSTAIELGGNHEDPHSKRASLSARKRQKTKAKADVEAEAAVSTAATVTKTRRKRRTNAEIAADRAAKVEAKAKAEAVTVRPPVWEDGDDSEETSI